jgi:glycerophosphoryl diester phosphodiesterase
VTSDFSIIAHRGACGYLPEHTLAAKALAFAQGADFLEQDLVASRDGALVVLHDVHLDRVTDVATVFPDRARDDGRYYARDFDLDELLILSAWERSNADGSAVYPTRFPARSGSFRLHTLGAELEMIQGLESATARAVGIYPEIKRPAWHQAEGTDLTLSVLEELADHGYATTADRAFLQCFDFPELRRIRHELGSKLQLVQLLGENSWGESQTDYDALRTAAGLTELAETVDAIGPWVSQLYAMENGKPVSTGLAERAQELGLLVHPYTLRADDLAPGFRTFDEQCDFLINTLAVDGVFTDFPDLVLRAARNAKLR